jgi:hypothetical protein
MRARKWHKSALSVVRLQGLRRTRKVIGSCHLTLTLARIPAIRANPRSLLPLPHSESACSAKSAVAFNLVIPTGAAASAAERRDLHFLAASIFIREDPCKSAAAIAFRPGSLNFPRHRTPFFPHLYIGQRPFVIVRERHQPLPRNRFGIEFVPVVDGR